jgi:alkanesulfonate monooxygenase SsuD/methylene tetrahydromethanopterin reductase-like flavin-dependent oxidoreductase (luciferase family)
LSSEGRRVSREQTRLYNRNRFKLGVFAPNCAGGLAMLKRQLWDGSWDGNLEVARRADEAGFEFILPLGRWRTVRADREGPDEGGSFETVTWAAAVLAATREICCFGTVHTMFISPVFAAKMMVTADHVGAGRFALNIVSGSHAIDFAMFGVDFPDNAGRYAYTDEWVTILKRAWTEEAPFDFHGTYFNLKGVIGKPKPYGGTLPMIVNAANSPIGRAFAARQTDVVFMTINEVDLLKSEISKVRAVRDVPVLASGHLVARASTAEAREYYDYVVRELGDWEQMEELVAERVRGREKTSPMAVMNRLRERLISAGGVYPVIGSYDDAAAEFVRMTDAGLDGMAVALFDYLGEFHHFQEVATRMERLGLRGLSGSATAFRPAR